MAVKRKILNNAGTTIVEVIVAVMVLAIVSVMLASALKAALNLTYKSQQIDILANRTLENYYLGNLTPNETEVTFIFNRGSQTIKVKTTVNEYNDTEYGISVKYFDIMPKAE